MAEYAYLSEKFAGRLSKDEQKRYLIDMKNGSVEAREKIFEHNIRLVPFTINKYFKNLEFDIDDVYSIGCLGLTKAVNTYDVDKGYDFSTYACKCIFNEIHRTIRNWRSKPTPVSLNTAVKETREEKNIDMIDTIVDEKSDFREEIFENSVNGEIRKVISELPDSKEKEIAMKYYGFNSIPSYQKDIAKEYGIAQSQVCRIVRNVTRTIALMLESRDIIELSNREVKRLKIKRG